MTNFQTVCRLHPQNLPALLNDTCRLYIANMSLSPVSTPVIPPAYPAEASRQFASRPMASASPTEAMPTHSLK